MIVVTVHYVSCCLQHDKLPPGGDSKRDSVYSEDGHDPWCITSEQREYYTKQFKTMQADIEGRIDGRSHHQYSSLQKEKPVTVNVRLFTENVPTFCCECPTFNGECPTFNGECPTLYGEYPTFYGECSNLKVGHHIPYYFAT